MSDKPITDTTVDIYTGGIERAIEKVAGRIDMLADYLPAHTGPTETQRQTLLDVIDSVAVAIYETTNDRLASVVDVLTLPEPIPTLYNDRPASIVAWAISANGISHPMVVTPKDPRPVLVRMATVGGLGLP